MIDLKIQTKATLIYDLNCLLSDFYHALSSCLLSLPRRQHRAQDFSSASHHCSLKSVTWHSLPLRPSLHFGAFYKIRGCCRSGSCRDDGRLCPPSFQSSEKRWRWWVGSPRHARVPMGRTCRNTRFLYPAWEVRAAVVWRARTEAADPGPGQRGADKAGVQGQLEESPGFNALLGSAAAGARCWWF